MSCRLNESMSGEVKIMLQEGKTSALFLNCDKEILKKRKKNKAKKEEIFNGIKIEKEGNSPLEEEERCLNP